MTRKFPRMAAWLTSIVICCGFAGPVAAQQFTARTIAGASASAEQMAEKAAAFLATLSPEQRALAVFPLDSDDRAWWSNLPAGMFPRFGLMLGELDDEQRIAFHELLRASTSSQGYLKMAGIVHMDELLSRIVARTDPAPLGIERGSPWPGAANEQPPLPAELESALREENAQRQEQVDALVGGRARTAPTIFSAGNYFFTLYNTPSVSEDWGWHLTGHHLTATFTVVDGRVAFTPMFLGSQPLMAMKGSEAGWTPLPHEGDRGFELMRSLTREQQRVARLSEKPGYEVFAGPGRRDRITEFEGLEASDMSPDQKMLLRVLVDEYVRNVDFDAADAHLAAIAAAGWDELRFAWQGPSDDPDEIFYYRVHGPRLLIEFSWETLNHIHTIVRDPVNDYGEDWLDLHYQERHPNSDAARALGFRRTDTYLEEYRNRQNGEGR